MKTNFRTYLKQCTEKKLPIFLDGGMGTMIQSSGYIDFNIPEDVSITNPDLIKNIHTEYLKSGANILTTNTFGAIPIKLQNQKITYAQYIETSINIAKQAIAEFEVNDNSKPHFIGWDISQTGQLLEPMGSLTFDEAYNNYAEAALIAKKSGADLAIVETMSDLYEAKAAILAIKENTDLPILLSMTFQSNLRTLTGADVKTCVTYIEALGVDVLGFNCGGSLQEGEILAKEFCKYSHIPVCVQPNAGIPVVQNGKPVFLVKPEEFASSQKNNCLNGVSLFGGCCGTTPAHIKELVQVIEKTNIQQKQTVKNIDNTLICSYNNTVQIGGSAGPQIIGERINPTGKKKVKEALQNHDMGFILEEAESQINAGATILDVNVGLPGINEADTMLDSIKTIQQAFTTPLQIDSSEPEVIEKALRYYNGKALINSVNGKQSVMDKIFPLVKHYGGTIVALCLDEDGIAPTAEGRIKVAKKIINEAQKYGIKPSDIVIDALTLTVSSQQKEALETCKTISLLKEEYESQGLKFILGVSNISFGLPRRDIINSRFFAMALYAGLDACIINPLSEPMMETYYGYRALANYDENCLTYIEKYNGSKTPIYNSELQQESKQEKTNFNPTPKLEFSNIPLDSTENEKNLIDIIYKGFKDKVKNATEQLLNSCNNPISIIDRCIVPALDAVGKDFEKGTKFLPQLLLSAETVSESFEVIKSHLNKTGIKQESKGSIVIATVYGDIHDIGKNIVKAMLENYGYTVIDLGKNVSYDTLIETVIKNNIQLVGLSALMTTTVTNMEISINKLRKALKEVGKSCKIMVGGAVLTPDYAKEIGADYYSKDAMASVAIAKEVFNA